MSSLNDHIVTLVVLIGCVAVVVAQQDQLLHTFQYQSSPLDWCEENYVYSPWIVEFWNTVSSLALCAVAVAGLAVYGRQEHIRDFEPRFYFLWSLLFVVGAGSVWFHGTLSIAGQIMDEVPIVILASVSVMMARPNWTDSSRDLLLSGHNIIRASSMFLVFCLFFPVASHIFTLFCFPGCGYYFITDYVRSTSPNVKRLFWTSFTTFSIAFGSWIIDRVACTQIQDIGVMMFGNPGAIQLHAIWHVFIGLTAWLVIALGTMLRADIEGSKVKITNDNWILFPVTEVIV